MICETVSRKEIRGMRVGQVGIFTLPNKMAKESVRVQFSKVKDLSEGKFDYESVKEEEYEENRCFVDHAVHGAELRGLRRGRGVP